MCIQPYISAFSLTSVKVLLYDLSWEKETFVLLHSLVGLSSRVGLTFVLSWLCANCVPTCCYGFQDTLSRRPTAWVNDSGQNVDTVRMARDEMFEGFFLGLPSMLLEKPGTPPRVVTNMRPPYPEFPVDYVDTIVIGDVKAITARLLGSGRGIYSEYLVRPDTVILDKKNSVGTADSIELVELGGFLSLSDGRILGQLAKGLGKQFEEGDKYLLFLNYRDAAKVFQIWKAWKVVEGKLEATSNDDLARVRSGGSLVHGMPVGSVSNAIRALLPRN